MSEKFRALMIEKEDDTQTVNMVEIEDNDLMEGNVLVKITHSTLNYKDGLAITGASPVVRSFPMIPGIDLSGIVLSSEDKNFSEEYKKKQAEMMKEALKKNDIVICTALIPGKPAPRILTEDLVKLMRAGSIIYDLAAEQGGNSAFSEAGKINLVQGIKIIGVKSLMNSLPLTASNLYSKNLFSFIRNLYSREKKNFNINLEDEIIEKSLIKKV